MSEPFPELPDEGNGVTVFGKRYVVKKVERWADLKMREVEIRISLLSYDSLVEPIKRKKKPKEGKPSV